MSILAHITVVQCDGCEHLETLTNDVENESFKKLWLQKNGKDFCVICRERFEPVDDAAMERAVATMVRKYAPLQLETNHAG